MRQARLLSDGKGKVPMKSLSVFVVKMLERAKSDVSHQASGRRPVGTCRLGTRSTDVSQVRP